MAKGGRLFVPLDVNWYDEWGHTVSADAALVWILALTTCKRMRLDGVLTRSQLFRVAPTGMTGQRFDEVIDELHRGDVAPMSADDRNVYLHGWSEWNDMSSDYADASQSGMYGNHMRWHVKAQKPSNNCVFCINDDDVSGRVGCDDRPESKSRVENSREETNVPIEPSTPSVATYETDFDACWKHYPRKIARKAALKAYIAQRRKGVPADVLLTATQHFVKAMTKEGRTDEHVLHGATFYGPSDRWEDYVEAPEPEPVEAIASGATRLRYEDYAGEMGDRVVLPGEHQGRNQNVNITTV